MFSIVFTYFRLCRKCHFFLDIFITCMLIFGIYSIGNGFHNVSIEKLDTVLRIFIPILTFIATLHSSSLIFFANSSSELIKKLKEEYIIKNRKKTDIPKINQIYSYFAWTIVVQFVSLIFFLLILCADTSMDNHENTMNGIISTSYVLLIVISLGIYSIILSLRNTCIFFSILIWNHNEDN